LPSRTRISRHAGRRRFRRGVSRNAEIHLTIRSSSPMDGSAQGSRLFRLRHQLSDRHRPWSDCRCRSYARHSSGRGRRAAHHARADGRSLQSEAGVSDRRQRLRFGRNLAWLVKQKKITPHIPVFDKSARTDGTFSRAEFTFDPEGTDIPARPARSWFSLDAPMRPHGPASRPKARASIARARRIATHANSTRAAARMWPPAKFRVICMKTPGMSPGLSPRRRNMKRLVAAERKSRCCSPISSVSSALDACGCEDHAAQRTNSTLLQPRRICDGSRD